MKYEIFVISILMILVLSMGCIGEKKVEIDDNNGIRINEFSVDPQTAEADDIVRFYLDIENVGGTTARCVKAELFGVDSWYDANGNPISYPLAFGGEFFNFRFTNINGAFSICYNGNVIGNLLGKIFDTNVNTRDGVCYTKNREGSSFSMYVSNVWNDFSRGLCTAYQEAAIPSMKIFRDLAPPYPARNRPGDFVSAEWDLIPPTLPPGVEVTYPVTARVSYFYSTSANINIRAFNKAEYKRMTDLGKQTQFPVEVTNSPGSPIKVFVKKGTSPIVVNQQALSVPGSSPYEFATYSIEFRNVGNGYPLPIENDVYGRSGLIFGTIELRGPGAFFYDCMGQRHQQGYVWGDALFISGELARLRSDNTAPFSCTIAIDRSQWINRPKDTISLVFNLHYVYYVEKEISVKVIGMEEPVF